ncbi:hypothetical protein ACFQXB_05295 [Plastorhodobacter daqingensis]|uniref:Uncharacterized protein n=1 Tax=Plastorhodobacter daqingensis TaxID=1387281 RepID=A0ABW2UG42_9RHOB
MTDGAHDPLAGIAAHVAEARAALDAPDALQALATALLDRIAEDLPAALASPHLDPGRIEDLARDLQELEQHVRSRAGEMP